MRVIDADKALENIKKRLIETAYNNSRVVCDAAYLYADISANRIETWINEVPTVDVEPVNHWIPCSERLPEDKDVLISYRYKEGEGDTSHVEIDITSYGTVCFGGRQIHTLKEWRQPFDYFHANYEVVAWMPLPKPYEVKK